MSSAVSPTAQDQGEGTRYNDGRQGVGGRVADRSRVEVVARQKDRFGGMKFGSVPPFSVPSWAASSG